MRLVSVSQMVESAVRLLKHYPAANTSF
jgi:hypothetical protein